MKIKEKRRETSFAFLSLNLHLHLHQKVKRGDRERKKFVFQVASSLPKKFIFFSLFSFVPTYIHNQIFQSRTTTKKILLLYPAWSQKAYLHVNWNCEILTHEVPYELEWR